MMTNRPTINALIGALVWPLVHLVQYDFFDNNDLLVPPGDEGVTKKNIITSKRMTICDIGINQERHNNHWEATKHA